MASDSPRPGLAAERTQLAWGRSALSFIVCGLAVARGIPGVTDDGRPVYGLVLVVSGGVIWLAASPWRALSGRPDLRPRAQGHLSVVAFGTMLVGIAALVVSSISVP